jgi:RimJ/RimL family protein N-acetyltransferase
MRAATDQSIQLGLKPANNDILYAKQTGSGLIKFRSLELSTDLDIIFDWVNRDYSKRFWQMNGSKEALRGTYIAMLENPAAHSFIALLANEPVAQVDLYCVNADELKEHLEADNAACGLHIHMLPPDQSKKGLSLDTLKTFIDFYFSDLANGSLYGEPDVENNMANVLARRAGFIFLKTIQLSYKTANLYSFTRSRYNSINR